MAQNLAISIDSSLIICSAVPTTLMKVMIYVMSYLQHVYKVVTTVLNKTQLYLQLHKAKQEHCSS